MKYYVTNTFSANMKSIFSNRLAVSGEFGQTQFIFKNKFCFCGRKYQLYRLDGTLCATVRRGVFHSRWKVLSEQSSFTVQRKESSDDGACSDGMGGVRNCIESALERERYSCSNGWRIDVFRALSSETLEVFRDHQTVCSCKSEDGRYSIETDDECALALSISLTVAELWD